MSLDVDSSSFDINLNSGSVTGRLGSTLEFKLKTTEGPFMIGVAGGTASGKSSVCKKITQEIDEDASIHKRIVCIAMDTFYKDLNPEDAERALRGEVDFDHPDAFDFELMNDTLTRMKQGKEVRVPKYDFRTNSRTPGEFTTIPQADVILCEGILTFYWKELREKFDMKLFVDTDSDTRLARRVRTDITERGRSLSAILNQYINLVKPAFEDFCLPTKKFADIIIPRGADNTVAIDLIVQGIKDILSDKSKKGPLPGLNVSPHIPTLIKRNSDSKTSRLH